MQRNFYADPKTLNASGDVSAGRRCWCKMARAEWLETLLPWQVAGRHRSCGALRRKSVFSLNSLVVSAATERNLRGSIKGSSLCALPKALRRGAVEILMVNGVAKYAR